ncbi:SDR family oxidoreductase [Nonomuraea sp. NPDC050383]|uniref:SDR family oxidoreductase n=1 Tax=Nonomuraea sp. NPDC050383 TaxID=3364362 RepID=UPI0037A14265
MTIPRDAPSSVGGGRLPSSRTRPARWTPSARSGQAGRPAGATYPAAKGALEAAAKVLAVREAGHGVLTNVVRPGFTLTDRVLSTPWLGQGAVDAGSAETPTGRICTPEDVASAAAYLGSAANRHVNGEILSVAGGRHPTR